MHLHRAAIALAIVVVALPAYAAPIGKKACKTLKKDYERLLETGLQRDMDRGPQWAKNNLPPERIESIKYLIEMEEKLSFRCGHLVTAKPSMKKKEKPTNKGASASKDTATGTKASKIKLKKTKKKQKGAYVPPPKSIAFSPSGY